MLSTTIHRIRMSSGEELIHRISLTSLEELSSASSSVEIISSSDDLLSEILRRLPVKSLLKFKSVSKHWRCLITDPHFSRRHKIRTLKPASSLFLEDYPSPILSFVPLDPSSSHTTAPFTDLSFLAHSPRRIEIGNSCNGLFYCYSSDCDTPRTYYICNPITKQFRTLPPPLGAAECGKSMALAFDPSESHLYKLICVKRVTRYPEDTRQIQIYSSETGSWRFCGAPFHPPPAVMDFCSGVYLNGAIHWVSWGTISLYFDVKEEVIREMPMPPPPDESDEREFIYFGESLGHLHLVEDYTFSDTDFGLNVWEMESDRARWFVKFKISLNAVALTFPEDRFEIVCVVRGVKDEDSFMAVHVPGKIIAYNFNTNSECKICDLDFEIKWSDFPWAYAHQFSESLSPV